MTSFEDLPLDLVTNILCRLPVKNLGWFKSVSKSWNRIINNSDFIKSHLKTSNDTRLFLLCYDPNQTGKRFLHSTSLDSLQNLSTEVYPAVGESLNDIELVGSCNGLVCTVHSARSERGYIFYRVFLLWNVAIKEYRIIQNPPTLMVEYDSPTHRRIPSYDFGLGYDSVNDDYKVLRVGSLRGRCETKFYSLKNDAWSETRVYPKKSSHFFYGVGMMPFCYANNALHFMTNRRGDTWNRVGPCYIVAIDLVTEDIREVELPDILGKRKDLTLRTMGECLCVITSLDDVWVMKDYGVKESWTKLFQIPKAKLCNWTATNGIIVFPPEFCVFSTNGDKTLLQSFEDGVKYGTFDHTKGEFDQKVRYEESILSMTLYTESLVSLKSYSRSIKRT